MLRNPAEKADSWRRSTVRGCKDCRGLDLHLIVSTNMILPWSSTVQVRGAVRRVGGFRVLDLHLIDLRHDLPVELSDSRH